MKDACIDTLTFEVGYFPGYEGFCVFGLFFLLSLYLFYVKLVPLVDVVACIKHSSVDEDEHKCEQEHSKVGLRLRKHHIHSAIIW